MAQAPELPAPAPDDWPGDAGEPDVGSLSQAAEWYAALRAEDASETDRQAWQAWLQARPEHARAWRYIEQVGRMFAPLKTHGTRQAAAAGLKAARKAAAGRRRVLGSLGGLAAGGLLAWLAWRHSPVPAWLLALNADYHTGTGQQRKLTLPDGSAVWLNTASALDVDYDSTARALRLLAGEILVTTVRDGAGRPFFVRTPFGRMQALGTQFTVRLGDGDVRLDVFDGAVEVVNLAGLVRRVRAGEHLRFDARLAPDSGPADRARQAWSRGVVVADDIPLQALVDELSRYRHGHISVAPEVAGLPAIGVYPATDPDRALALLEHALPIRVRQPLPWWTVIEARREP
ncbi:FecR domain-containing protein [Pigmentiphaga soli]|uniref:FecR domain-containing protein n=2 Tax=Pigmentiphaga soli TaxID=1007095 RepID=A0ABP8HTJ1_9BURK